MSNRYNYQPFYNEGIKPHIINIPFGRFAWLTVSLPFFGLLFCVLWSLIYDFERATFTHCQVYNVLPSLSAAIGSFSPQKEVWQWAVGLQAFPRFIVAFMYKKYHKEVLFPWAHCFSTVACLLNVIEVTCLIGLSFWTSTDNYSNLLMFVCTSAAECCGQCANWNCVSAVHKTCFVTFVVTSELYMLITCILFKRCRRHPPMNVEIKSLRIKGQLVIFNICSIILASYFFMRHNSYCEPGVYSLFALFEYLVVLSNMAFHMTAYWDFFDRDLVLNEDCDVDLIYR